MAPSLSSEEAFMQRALELARKGIAHASPNPCVGAVIVNSESEIVGEGFHTYDGKKHAEVLAIEQAGEHARGCTLYLNLEPCSHTGRTGPCADAVIAAGITRVVCGMRDPNPQVSGLGFERLRAAGIEVVEGILQQQARKLNEGFAKYIRTEIPLVTLKSAMTLDGKIAPAPVETSEAGTVQPGWITGEVARAHVHEQRHAMDAIVVGVGTVISDDPLLTDRSGLPRRRPLLRVVLDSSLRLPLDSRLVKTAHNDLLVFCSFAEEKKRRALEDRGVEVEQVSLSKDEPSIGGSVAGGRPDLHEVLRSLGKREITSVMIEGGAMVNWAALSSGIVDKLFLYYAPRILGGGAVPLVRGTGYKSIDQSLHLSSMKLHRFGEDFAVEGYLKDPYGTRA